MGNKANTKKLKGREQNETNKNILNSRNLGKSLNFYNNSLESTNNSQNSNNFDLNSDLITNLNRTYTFQGQKSYNLIVHKNDGMNDYIIELNLTKFDKNKAIKKAEFIMILDISGSMGGHVHKLISDIIPKGLNIFNNTFFDKY